MWFIHKNSISSGWSFKGVVFHQCSLSSKYSFNRVVSSEGGLLPVWPLIKAVFHKFFSSSSDQSFQWVVVHQCTLSSSLSSLHQNGLAFMRVVSLSSGWFLRRWDFIRGV